MANIVLENVPEELAKRILNKSYAEVAFRKGNEQFDMFKKIAVRLAGEKDQLANANKVRQIMRAKNPLQIQQLLPNIEQIFAPMKSLKIFSALNTALSAANLVATVAGIIIICEKIDKIDRKLDELKDGIVDLKDINFELQISNPCRALVNDYKIIGDKINKGKPVSEDDLVELINGCHGYIISLYNLRDKFSLDAVLSLIFTLLPIFANSIMIYYQLYYDEKQEKHTLHDGWMNVFELLSAENFMNQIQDHMFVDLHQTNQHVNEYLDCYRLILQSYQQKINQLLEDLKTCEGVEGYNEAMLWSKQYAAQQARVVQAEMASRYGEAQAQQYCKAAMEAALV